MSKHSTISKITSTNEQLINENDAIYIGIAFLDTFLNCSQGLVVFGLFGLESTVVLDPLVKWVETVRDLYFEPPSNEKDPRLYDWTIKVAVKIIAWLPKREKVNPEFNIMQAALRVPLNPMQLGYADNQTKLNENSSRQTSYLRASFAHLQHV